MNVFFLIKGKNKHPCVVEWEVIPFFKVLVISNTSSCQGVSQVLDENSQSLCTQKPQTLQRNLLMFSPMGMQLNCLLNSFPYCLRITLLAALVQEVFSTMGPSSKQGLRPTFMGIYFNPQNPYKTAKHSGTWL